MYKKLTAFFLFSLFLLPACSLLGSVGVATEATPVPATATVGATPAVAANATPALATPATVTETTRSLIVWMPPEIASRNEAASTLLSEQILTFGARHPDVNVVVEQKMVSGQGGILSYLRTGRSVAPSVLPDLVVVPGDKLATAAAEELIYPLETAVEPDLFNDLFPAAEQVARQEEHVLGIPFAITNLPHLAYNAAVTDTLPLRWQDLVASAQGPLIFPAAGPQGAVVALGFYQASGGTLAVETGQPLLQVGPLTNGLNQLYQARNSGFISPQSSNVATLQESWQVFANGSAAYALTTSAQFLQETSSDARLNFGPVPGPDGPLAPLVDSWAWAVSTSDPEKQALAVELLASLSSPENLGEWSAAANILPARRSAFTHWSDTDPYVAFVQQELERAQPNPMSANSQLMNVLSDAIFDVISLAVMPQTAAETAVSALEP